MMPRVAVLLLTAVVLSATAGAKSAVHVPLQTTEQLTITAKPVLLNPDDPRQKTIGALRYLGGLHLTSAHKNFGGWSGLRMLPDGKRLLAISDEGNWGVFNIEEKADQLVDVKTGLIAPFRDAHGTPLTSKFETDCESVELVPSANAVDISFEHHHRFLRYAWNPNAPIEDLLAAPGIAYHEDYADFFAKLPLNGGVEALAERPDMFLAISEEGDVPGGGKAARMIVGTDRKQIDFAIRPVEDFKATDAHWLKNGQLLVLERRFSILSGVRAAVQLFDISADGAGKSINGLTINGLTINGLTINGLTINGLTLAQLALPYTVDNMEGLAVVEKAGRTFLYIISDDNFSGLQRTLLLKFEWLR